MGISRRLQPRGDVLSKLVSRPWESYCRSPTCSFRVSHVTEITGGCEAYPGDGVSDLSKACRTQDKARDRGTLVTWVIRTTPLWEKPHRDEISNKYDCPELRVRSSTHCSAICYKDYSEIYGREN